jgi:hypothetical protein
VCLEAIRDVIAILPAYRSLNVKAVSKMNELHKGNLDPAWMEK